MSSPCRDAATIDTAVLADQGRHRGHAAGDGDASGRGGGGRAVLHLGGDVEVRAAVEISAAGRAKGERFGRVRWASTRRVPSVRAVPSAETRG